MIDETVDPTGQDPERVGFCQDCGKPVNRETARIVGSRTFCEPCLTTRVAAGTAYGTGAVPPPPAGAGAAYGPGSVPPGSGYSEPFPPMGGSNPSPALAAVLGFIPGVGAMYNGQFAKGIAHIVIFAILQSMANHNGFFGIVVAGFVFYQVFEAYHTAKARRDGMPLPDPFGLNNIGEHVGVHFNQRPGARNPGQPTSYPGWTGYVPPQGAATPPPPPAGEWQGVATPPPVAPYTQAAPVWDTPAWTPPPSGTVPPAEVFAPAAPPVSMANRIPGAAIWLIGFGVLFTVLNFVPDWRFSLTRIFPFVLMALGVGLFVRRMLSTGGLAPTETEGLGYGPRVVCSLRGPAILVTLGVLTMLQSFDVVRFGRTWPILVIVIGVLLLLERSLGGRTVPVVPIVIDDSGVANGKGL